MTTTSAAYEGSGKEEHIYTRRFTSSQDATRSATWKLLCTEFLQRYIHPYDTVVDLGAGDGHFIRNISAGRRIAVDLSPHVLCLEKDGIEVIQAPGQTLATLLKGQVDVVFMSNFLEHMPNKKVVLDILDSCFACLRPGGRVMILQPNIRYVGAAYWDYIDHHVALTEHSLVEALEVCGFTIERLIPRFLPYTAKSRLGGVVSGGNRSWIIRLYLRLPLLWRLFGAQTFVVATRSPI